MQYSLLYGQFINSGLVSKIFTGARTNAVTSPLHADSTQMVMTRRMKHPCLGMGIKEDLIPAVRFRGIVNPPA